MSTTTPVSILCVMERFRSMHIPTPVSAICVEGDFWLFEQSYSSVCYFC